jgi:copper chaperone CopZ
MQKLNGVESVEMSLERASATIRLRPGNRVSLPALRQIVKDNGFRATEATSPASGQSWIVTADRRSS